MYLVMILMIIMMIMYLATEKSFFVKLCSGSDIALVKRLLQRYGYQQYLYHYFRYQCQPDYNLVDIDNENGPWSVRL